MSDKKRRNEKVKPNWFIWFIYTFLSRIYIKLIRRTKIDNKVFKNRNKKAGAVVIYNHGSNKDHLFATASFKYTRVNYVITKYFYFNKFLAVVLNWVKAISREQFKPDMASIRKMKRVIDRNGVVCIAPAGQITIHGEQLYIDKAIVKLLKFCKADVYTLQINGAYNAFPKWGKKTRRSLVHTKMIKTLSTDELESLSEDEIYRKVIGDINIIDRLNQNQKPKPIKGKALIEGLERVIYYCPKCNQKYTMTSYLHQMECSCGNRFKMNRYGFLEGIGDNYVIFENEAQWYYFEKRKIKEAIINGNFRLEANFELLSNPHEPLTMESVGKGRLVLTPTEFYYEGTFEGVDSVINFNLEKLIQLPFSAGRHFEIPDMDYVYKFIPLDNPNIVIEWVQTIDVMREMRTEKDNECNKNF